MQQYADIYSLQSHYMFRVSQHPSSGVLKTVTAASGTGHNTGTATSLQRGLIGTGLCLVGFLLTLNCDARNHEFKKNVQLHVTKYTNSFDI